MFVFFSIFIDVQFLSPLLLIMYVWCTREYIYDYPLANKGSGFDYITAIMTLGNEEFVSNEMRTPVSI